MTQGFVSGLPGSDLRSVKSLEQTISDARFAIRECPRSKKAARRALEDQADAEEWYRERLRQEQIQAAELAAEQRRDRDLPEEDLLPF